MINVGNRVQITGYEPGNPPDDFLSLYEPALTSEEAVEVTKNALVGMTGFVYNKYVVGESDELSAEDTNIPVGETAYLVVFDSLPPLIEAIGGKRPIEPTRFEQFELFRESELEIIAEEY